MIQDLLTPAVLAGIVYSGIRLATPYLYATLGETIGQLRGVHIGPLSPPELDNRIEELLAEPAPSSP